MATITGGKTYFIPIPGLEHILAASPLMAAEMAKIGTTMATVAKSRVPRDTGATYDSIQGGAVFEGGQWIARASANTPYAPFIEFGTEDTPTVPFMRDALAAALGHS